MSFQLSEDAAGMIVLTMVDHAANAFVSLAAFEWKDADEFRIAWDSVPQAPGKTAFLADRHGPEGHDADRYVTAEWIEQVSGRRLEDLIAEGRAENARVQRMLRDRLSVRGTMAAPGRADIPTR